MEHQQDISRILNRQREVGAKPFANNNRENLLGPWVHAQEIQTYFQAEMVPTLGFATERHPSNTRGNGNFHQVTACDENHWGKEIDTYHTGEWQTKPLSEPYYLTSQEAYTFEGNKAAPAHMDRSDGHTPERDMRRLKESKRTIFCVETPHWEYNTKNSTNIG